MASHMNKANASIPNNPQGSPRNGTVFHSGFPITLAQSQTLPEEQKDPPPISAALLCIQSVCAETVKPPKQTRIKPASALPCADSSEGPVSYTHLRAHET